MHGIFSIVNRSVAQLGRALRSGRRGRRFESCHSDFFIAIPQSLDYWLCGFSFSLTDSFLKNCSVICIIIAANKEN